LPLATVRRWEEATGGLLVEGYGMTETSPVALGVLLHAWLWAFTPVARPAERASRSHSDRFLWRVALIGC
ncbi:hypothetical protein ACWDR7_12660, partial [Microbacterium sp. NPDC003461]